MLVALETTQQKLITFKNLKKLSAILFLTALLALQYSKQWQYLQCKIINAIATQHCDCEKQFESAPQNSSSDLPAEKSILPSAPDEFYLFTASAFATGKKFNSPAPFSTFYKFNLPTGYGRLLLKPPQQSRYFI